MGKSERHFGTNDEHCTPPEIFEPIVRVWGAIGFDPCHSPASRVPARIRVWLPEVHQRVVAGAPSLWVPYSLPSGESRLIVGNGLWLDWLELQHEAGDTPGFVNMPYSHIEPWNKKSSEDGAENITLQPARTGSGYWRDWIWPTATAICFMERGQIFESMGKPVVNTNPKSKTYGKPMNTPWHSVLGYWGDNLDAFRAAYDLVGEIVEL